MIRAGVLGPSDVAVLQRVCLRAYEWAWPMLSVRGHAASRLAEAAMRAEIAHRCAYELWGHTDNRPLTEALRRLRDAALCDARRMGV